jgi:hypothetical protein
MYPAFSGAAEAPTTAIDLGLNNRSSLDGCIKLI